MFRRKIDTASVLSKKLYDQQRQLSQLRVADANMADAEDFLGQQLVKQQIKRLNLQFEINQHRLQIELKERELKALPK